MQRLRIWVETDAVRPGAVVEVFGPGADGLLDSAAGEPLGRVTALRWADEAPGSIGAEFGGPETLGKLHGARVPVSVLSRPLGFGPRQFAARVLDGATGAPSSISATLTLYVNAPPRAVRSLTSIADIHAGRRAFSFAGSLDME